MPLAALPNFAIGMLRDLVRNGLATADREIVYAGRQPIIIVRLRITDAGRRALSLRGFIE